MKFTLSFVCLFSFLASCSKLNDSEKPVITIISPISKDTIPVTQSEIEMHFSITDNRALSSFILEITDSNGSVLYADSKEIQGTSYSYKNSFIVVTRPATTKTLTMTIHSSDESKNESIVKSEFYIAPAK